MAEAEAKTKAGTPDELMIMVYPGTDSAKPYGSLPLSEVAISDEFVDGCLKATVQVNGIPVTMYVKVDDLESLPGTSVEEIPVEVVEDEVVDPVIEAEPAAEAEPAVEVEPAVTMVAVYASIGDKEAWKELPSTALRMTDEVIDGYRLAYTDVIIHGIDVKVYVKGE